MPLLAAGASSPSTALNDAASAAEERIVTELRRENALYEIKSLDNEELDDVLGALAWTRTAWLERSTDGLTLASCL